MSLYTWWQVLFELGLDQVWSGFSMKTCQSSESRVKVPYVPFDIAMPLDVLIVSLCRGRAVFWGGYQITEGLDEDFESVFIALLSGCLKEVSSLGDTKQMLACFSVFPGLVEERDLGAKILLLASSFYIQLERAFYPRVQ